MSTDAALVMELVARTSESPESSSPIATTSVSGPEEDIEEVENENEVLSSGSLKAYYMVDVPNIEDVPTSQCELPENTDGLPLKQYGEIYDVGDDSFIQGSMPAMELNSKEEYSASAELEMMKEDLEHKMVEQLEKLSRLLNLETAHNGADNSHMKSEIGTLVSALKEEMDGCYDDDDDDEDDDEDADYVCTSSDPDEKYEYWQVDYSTGTVMWNPPKSKQDNDASLGVAVSKYMPHESINKEDEEEDEAEEIEDEAEEAEEESTQVLPAITASPPSTRLFEETETNELKQSESTAQSGAENVDEFSAKLASDIVADVLAEFPSNTFDSAQPQIPGEKGRNSAAVVASGQIFVIKEDEDEEESVQILQATTDSPQVSAVFEDTGNGQEEQNECTYSVQSGAATDVDEFSTELVSAVIDNVVTLVSSREPKVSEKEIDTEKSSKSAASVASELSFRSGSSVTIFEKEQSAILSEQASTAASTSTSPLECVVNSAQKMSSTLSRDYEFDCENTFESESTQIPKFVNTPNLSVLLATSSASTGSKSILMLPAGSNTGDISVVLTSPSNDSLNEEGVASSNSEDRHGVADETEMEINSAPILFSSAASHAPSIEGENVTRPEAIEPDDDDNKIVFISTSGEAVYMSPTTSNAELVQEVKETVANDTDEITERGSQWLKSSCQSVRKTGGMKLNTSLAGFRQSDLEEAADLPDRRSRAEKLGLFTAKSKPDTLPNECRITLRRLSNPDRSRVSFEELLHANMNGEATNLNTQVSVSSSDSEQRIRNDQSVDVSSHTSLSDNDKYVAASPSKKSKRSSRSSVRSSKSKVVAVNSESVSSREVKCGSRTSLGSKQSETHTRSSKISSTQSQTLNRSCESLEKMTTKSSVQSQKSGWLPEIQASANGLVDGGASQKQCVHSSSSIVHCHTLEQDSHKSLSDEKQVAAVSSRKSRRSSRRSLRSARSNVVVADDSVSIRKSSFSVPAMAHVSFSNKSMKSQASGTVQKTGSAVEKKLSFKAASSTVSAIAEQTEKGDSLSNMSNTISIQMETAAIVKATSGVKTSASSSPKYSQATLKAKSYAGVSLLPSKVKNVPKLSSSVASFRSSGLANAVSGLEQRRISTPEKSVLQQEKSELITAIQFDVHATEKKCSRRSRHGSERKLMGESSRDSVEQSSRKSSRDSVEQSSRKSSRDSVEQSSRKSSRDSVEQSSRKSIPDGESATRVDNSRSDKNDDRLPPLMQPERVSLPAIGGSQQMGFDVTAWMRANRDVVIAKQSSKKTSSGLDSKRIAKSRSDKGYAKLPLIMKRQNRSLPDSMNRSY